MNLVIIFVSLCCASQLFAASIPKSARILGGREVPISDHPHQVGYYQMNGHILSFLCGGSILSPKTVLTAAHCIGTENGLGAIRAGSAEINSGQLINVIEVAVHPEYDVVDYDLALLRLAKRLQFGDYVKPIDLPNLNSVVPVGSEVIVTGWGHTTESGAVSKKLLETSLTTISLRRCQLNYPNHKIFNTHICATGQNGTGRDTCQGDSGGPLVYNNTLVGVVSFGFGCGRPDVVGVYSNVGQAILWILYQTFEFEKGAFINTPLQ